MKQQLLKKEQGVKGEIERVWADWEDKCGELDDLRMQAEFRAQEAEGKLREQAKTA